MNKKYDIDLLVAGGGLAGCFSAIGARRTNPDISVLVVERLGFLGGMASAGYVFPFMRYFTSDPIKNKKKRLVGGLFKEMMDILYSKGYIPERKRADGLYTRFDPMMIRYVLDEMVVKAGVKVLFHTLANKVKYRSDAGEKFVNQVIVQTKMGEITFNTRCVVDATGDADIIYHSGGKVIVGRKSDGLVQPATLNFRIGNVKNIRASRGMISQKIKQEKKNGNKLTPRDDCLMFFAGDGQWHFNQTRVSGFNFLDPFELSGAEIEGRKQAERFISFLRKKIVGFKKSTIVSMGTVLGIRETRRIAGEYTVSEDDLLSCKQFQDKIALGNYPIDIHDPKGGPKTDIRRIPKGKWYSIPFRALIPQGFNNVLVAGRPISTSHVAHSATRVMPTCAAIGHAAGVAMGLKLGKYKDLSMKDIPIETIQEELKKQGAILE
ncbi:MAG: FAD-dependent oxidoreductase [Promethearchaeota archaeon]